MSSEYGVGLSFPLIIILFILLVIIGAAFWYSNDECYYNGTYNG
ncbi:YjcZ family sporulation protein [Neobacillus niacini]|nr:YjcZ family sporulation protein [Neobacillus niacini]MCM3690774.1 YjcZ family sporulation protein [Neobacillus niacini]